MWARVGSSIWMFCHNEAETEKSANRILYPWYVWAIISNNIAGAWFDPPSKPPPGLGWVMRKVSDGVEGEGLRLWGPK